MLGEGTFCRRQTGNVGAISSGSLSHTGMLMTIVFVLRSIDNGCTLEALHQEAPLLRRTGFGLGSKELHWRRSIIVLHIIRQVDVHIGNLLRLTERCIQFRERVVSICSCLHVGFGLIIFKGTERERHCCGQSLIILQLGHLIVEALGIVFRPTGSRSGGAMTYVVGHGDEVGQEYFVVIAIRIGCFCCCHTSLLDIGIIRADLCRQSHDGVAVVVINQRPVRSRSISFRHQCMVAIGIHRQEIGIGICLVDNLQVVRIADECPLADVGSLCATTRNGMSGGICLQELMFVVERNVIPRRRFHRSKQAIGHVEGNIDDNTIATDTAAIAHRIVGHFMIVGVGTCSIGGIGCGIVAI